MSLPTIVNITQFTGDEFTMDVTVSFDPSQEVTSLAGGTATFKAKPKTGATFTGSATIDVPNNRVRASAAPGSFVKGVYDIEVVVTIGGKPKTLVAGTMNVKQSL